MKYYKVVCHTAFYDEESEFYIKNNEGKCHD